MEKMRKKGEEGGKKIVPKKKSLFHEHQSNDVLLSFGFIKIPVSCIFSSDNPLSGSTFSESTSIVSSVLLWSITGSSTSSLVQT